MRDFVLTFIGNLRKTREGMRHGHCRAKKHSTKSSASNGEDTNVDRSLSHESDEGTQTMHCKQPWTLISKDRTKRQALFSKDRNTKQASISKERNTKAQALHGKEVLHQLFSLMW